MTLGREERPNKENERIMHLLKEQAKSALSKARAYLHRTQRPDAGWSYATGPQLSPMVCTRCETLQPGKLSGRSCLC